MFYQEVLCFSQNELGLSRMRCCETGLEEPFLKKFIGVRSELFVNNSANPANIVVNMIGNIH